MAIEAPISKFRKSNLLIYIVVCFAFAAWCLYDVHYNEDFKTKYAGSWWLTFNEKAPPYLVGLAALFGVYYFIIRNKKLIADENELIFSDKKRIPYDAIEKINKTHFETKGFFTITYKNSDGRQIDLKLGDRAYDNLPEILELLVAKIS
jgi:hypothetical protein